MSRRKQADKRITVADPVFNSQQVSRFVNRMMQRGKRSTAQSLFYDALQILKDRTKQEPLDVFNKALKNVTPLVEVKARRVGGSTYQVPVEVRADRRLSLGIRWTVGYARKRGERTMKEKLAGELMDAFNNTGAAIKKKEDTHKMAEANKAFAHYRW